MGRNINNLRYADDTSLKAESEEELKSLLMKVKEESEKAGLKHNIQKTKTMASSPITLWQIDGGTMETVTDFIFLGSKITVDGDYSHEIKRCFLLGRNTMTNLDSVLKSRDITLLTKVCLVKAIVFPVAMYGFDSIVTIVELLSSVRLFCNLMDYSPPGSSSMGFSWEEYWSGLPFPSPGDHLDPGIKPGFLMSPTVAGRIFTTSAT